VIGHRLPGAEGSAAAAVASALLYVPVVIVTLTRHPPTPRALGYAAAGILASAVPFLADLLALRRVPARFLGVFMSVNPVLAALVGLVIPGQSLGWAEWLAIAAIVGANTATVLTAGDRGPTPPYRKQNVGLPDG
jgi:inner membrane transporter RhtA